MSPSSPENAIGNAHWSIRYALEMLPDDSGARAFLHRAKNSLESATATLASEAKDASAQLL